MESHNCTPQNLYTYLTVHARGPENACKARVLAEAFDTEIRTIADTIRNLRTQGYIIGSRKAIKKASSSTHAKIGYWIPTNETEVQECLDCYESELRDMLFVFKCMRRSKHHYLEDLRTRNLFEHTFNHAGQMEMLMPAGGCNA